jgi:hypothetical protein
VNVVVLIVAGVLGWAAATLLLDAWWRRSQRPDLAERLRPFQVDSVADQAQRWVQPDGASTATVTLALVGVS